MKRGHSMSDKNKLVQEMRSFLNDSVVEESRDILFSFDDFQEILQVQQDVVRDTKTLKKYTGEHLDVIATIVDKTFKGFNTSAREKAIIMVWEVDIDDKYEGITYKTNVYLSKIAGQRGYEFDLHGDIWDIQH